MRSASVRCLPMGVNGCPDVGAHASVRPLPLSAEVGARLPGTYRQRYAAMRLPTSRPDRLTHTLNGAGFRLICLHGDRTQHQRLEALEGFRRGMHQMLVATDRAARGLDVERISHVVNYDVPGCPEDYVHRVGRTARAGAEGTAL